MWRAVIKALGYDEIVVANTIIGVGSPQRVRQVMSAVTTIADSTQISDYFHDIYGQALANILAALDSDIAIFHTLVAGLEWIYAKDTAGSVATRDVL